MPLFKNHPDHISHMVAAALAAADPAAAVRRFLRFENGSLTAGDRTFPVAGRLFVIGLGKAALTMGKAALDLAAVGGQRVAGGVLLAKNSKTAPHPPGVQVFEGAHPVPAPRNTVATHAILELLVTTTADDVILCLISGGGSALLTAPLIPFDAWASLNARLLASGCSINEFNAVRKRFDQVKGGGLAKAAAPATVVSLILSDVLGNPLDIIASGPTVEDTTTDTEVEAILQRYGIDMPLPAASYSQTKMSKVTNLIVGDLGMAAEAAATAARELGFETEIVDLRVEGEAAEIGRNLAHVASELPPNQCRIYGGESTVTLTTTDTPGKGGRNQAMALAAALSLQNSENTLFATLATDGEDGPTDAAGAFVTSKTVHLGTDAADYLERHDSYHFFEKIGYGHLITGSTGTNVNDLIFLLKYAG